VAWSHEVTAENVLVFHAGVYVKKMSCWRRCYLTGTFLSCYCHHNILYPWSQKQRIAYAVSWACILCCMEIRA